MSSHPPRLWRSSPFAFALLCAACGTTAVSGRPKSGVAEMQGRQQPARFAQVVPAGTHYAWDERRTFDATLVGTSRTVRDESDLRWDVSTHPSVLDTTVFDQRLVRATVTHDGRTVVDGAPEVTVQLVVDSGGNLQEVRGLDEASRVLRGLAEPQMRSWADRMFSPQDLRSLLVSRYDLFVGHVDGRPTARGTTWIATERPGGTTLLRRYTVEGTEPCGAALCTRLRVRLDIDPRVVDPLAERIVADYLQSQGRPAPKLTIERTSYGMGGTLLVDAATMQTHSATLREAGRVVVTAPDRAYEVDVHATTDDTFQYGPPEMPVGSL